MCFLNIIRSNSFCATRFIISFLGAARCSIYTSIDFGCYFVACNFNRMFINYPIMVMLIIYYIVAYIIISEKIYICSYFDEPNQKIIQIKSPISIKLSLLTKPTYTIYNSSWHPSRAYLSWCLSNVLHSTYM